MLEQDPYFKEFTPTAEETYSDCGGNIWTVSNVNSDEKTVIINSGNRTKTVSYYEIYFDYIAYYKIG